MHLVEKESFIGLKEEWRAYNNVLTDRKTYKQTEIKKGYMNNVYAFGGERVIH